MVLRTDSFIVILWNLFMSALTLFQIAKTVYQLGFAMETETRLMDFIIDIVFLIDIVSWFFIAYV